MVNFKQNLFIFCCCASMILFIPIRISSRDADFDRYLSKYNKSYNSSEYINRLKIFKRSLDMIRKYNIYHNDNLSASYGVTEFTDLIPEMILSELLKEENAYPATVKPLIWSPKLNIPTTVDWRGKGVVSKINNQKDCGACYAFTTIETVESLNAIKTGVLERFSIQQMIDCSLVSKGCDGGDTCTLLEWLTYANISIMKDTEYPLRLRAGKCKATYVPSGIYIKSFKCENFVNREEVILQYLANNGPVVAAVNASPWHYYLEGIVRYHCNGSLGHLNHAVQIVGYDMSGRVPYYIVRNSWGERFGMNGYIKIAIGSNTCGIANKIATFKI